MYLLPANKHSSLLLYSVDYTCTSLGVKFLPMTNTLAYCSKVNKTENDIKGSYPVNEGKIPEKMFYKMLLGLKKS